MYTYGIEICTLFSIKIIFFVAFKHKPLREDNLSTKDKWPNPKVSSLRRFHCITILLSMVLQKLSLIPERYILNFLSIIIISVCTYNSIIIIIHGHIQVQ